VQKYKKKRNNANFIAKYCEKTHYLLKKNVFLLRVCEIFCNFAAQIMRQNNK